jgi:hypothetical protein
MAALSFTTVGGAGRQACITFPADLLVAVVLGGKDFERGFDDPSAETGSSLLNEMTVGGMITAHRSTR